MLTSILWGVLLSGVVVIFSLRLQLLTKSGGVGTFAVGTIIFAFGGLYWALPLLAFFFSSSLLSKFRIDKKKKFRDLFQKDEKRDLFQVIANGGIPALIAIFNIMNSQYSETLFNLYLGSLAVANADTWATEIGLLSFQEPVSLKNFKKIPKGTSGGITFLGIIAALSGAFLMSLFSPSSMIIITSAGFFGSFADSYLGATLQVQYRCTLCGKNTEKRYHCNEKTRLEKGLSWMNNDVVNFFATLIGALIVLLFLWKTLME